MNFIEFDFQVESQQESETLVALLSSIGFEGFEESGFSLKAFVSEDGFHSEYFDSHILQMRNVRFTKTVIEDRNWNEEWERSFEPVIIADTVAIRANFHAAMPSVTHDILITPKMSFGTGHHATTALMVEFMLKIDFKDKRVIDFGTGTGVLAILAEKLGAAHVLAIDNDNWSIENARENIIANNSGKIEIHKAENTIDAGVADIVLANINLNVILTSLKDLQAISKTGTIAIFSGILNTDEQLLREALSIQNFTVNDVVHNKNWIAISTVYHTC